MTIETMYRAKCDPCERYLRNENSPYVSAATVTVDSSDAAYFINFSSAYAGAVARGWCAWPLRCPDCAAELKEKVQRVEVRRAGNPEEDGRGVPQGDQGPERASGAG